MRWFSPTSPSTHTHTLDLARSNEQSSSCTRRIAAEMKAAAPLFPKLLLSLVAFTVLLMLAAPPPVRGSLNSQGVNFEVQALMALKEQLVDSENALGSWDAHSVDPCSWYHVTCTNQQLVKGLDLPNLQLSGTLSPAIGNLTNLETLMLENNSISGNIPPEMGNLDKLLTLDLSNNNFSGQIPDTFVQLKILASLDLSYNNLSGRVPQISSKYLNVAGNTFLCGYDTFRACPGDPPLPHYLKIKEGGTTSGLSKKAVIAIVVAVGVIVMIMLFVILFWRRRHHNQQIFFDVNEQQDPEVCLGQLKKFSFRDLQTATENFHARNILGRGGFGNVYKGCLPDGSVVAIKRLKDRDVAGGEVQFQTEVEMISLAVHRNLLRLIGFCVTSTERLLVYPFMPNGSVASRLRDKPALDWSTRKQIAVGSARGLLYLHEQCDPKIIHRDVKAANILLDEDYEAVVGDFGLAKLLDHRESHVTTAVRGTVGHIAPEYLSTGQSSEKTDVFGFGILLLELITGQRAFDFGRVSNQKGYGLDWIKKLQQEKRLDELVDTELKDNFMEAELEEMVKVALLCTQFFPVDRPKMSEVVRMLEGDGLIERWDAWQRAETDRHRGADLQTHKYFDLVVDSTLVLQAMELSGPR